jgi:hypothetical protein
MAGPTSGPRLTVTEGERECDNYRLAQLGRPKRRRGGRRAGRWVGKRPTGQNGEKGRERKEFLFFFQIIFKLNFEIIFRFCQNQSSQK